MVPQGHHIHSTPDSLGIEQAIHRVVLMRKDDGADWKPTSAKHDGAQLPIAKMAGQHDAAVSGWNNLAERLSAFTHEGTLRPMGIKKFHQIPTEVPEDFTSHLRDNHPLALDEPQIGMDRFPIGSGKRIAEVCKPLSHSHHPRQGRRMIGQQGGAIERVGVHGS